MLSNPGVKVKSIKSRAQICPILLRRKRTIPLGLENNHAGKWISDNFPGMPKHEILTSLNSYKKGLQLDIFTCLLRELDGEGNPCKLFLACVCSTEVYFYNATCLIIISVKLLNTMNYTGTRAYYYSIYIYGSKIL